MSGIIFLSFWGVSTLILTLGMMWGDYKDGHNTLIWKHKKSGVNSGAKFG